MTTDCHVSISLDGYLAGPGQGLEAPVGVGGFHDPVVMAGGRNVRIAGGASTIRQALAAGVLEELTLDVVPVLLGAGERLFDGVADPGLEPVAVGASPFATHVTYRIRR